MAQIMNAKAFESCLDGERSPRRSDCSLMTAEIEVAALTIMLRLIHIRRSKFHPHMIPHAGTRREGVVSISSEVKLPPTMATVSRSGHSLELGDFLSSSSFDRPRTLGRADWIEHAPFAFWLVEASRPQVLVDFGMDDASSFLVFAQAIQEMQQSCRCFAVDIRDGGQETVSNRKQGYLLLREEVNRRYASFCQLLHTDHDSLNEYFRLRSVDLLHINPCRDGQSSAEHFEAWKPMLSNRAVVLVHGIRPEAGHLVNIRLWNELSKAYPSFEFLHGGGLGVLAIGDAVSEPVALLCEAGKDPGLAEQIGEAYARLGEAIRDLCATDDIPEDIPEERSSNDGGIGISLSQTAQDESRLITSRAQNSSTLVRKALERDRLLVEVFQKSTAVREQRTKIWRAESEIAVLRSEIAGQNKLIESLRGKTSLQLNEHSALQAQIHARMAELQQIKGSLSWKCSRPIRAAGAVFGVTSFRRNLRLRRQRRLIDDSNFFDANWYLKTYPDVAAAQQDPIEHYLLWGGFEGRDPSADFDSNWYLLQYPDVAKAGVNPLVHYIGWGRAEGRSYRASQAAKPRTAAPIAAQAGLHPAPNLQLKVHRPRVVFISGESWTAGHRYRVLNMAEGLVPKYYETVILTIEELRADLELGSFDLLWIWRAPLTDSTAKLVDSAKAQGAKIVFDVDDLMFRPELATVELIDGIRSMGQTESDTRRTYEQVREMLARADHFVTPTVSLAHEARTLGKPATVIPNGFERERLQASATAMLIDEQSGHDGLVRIGYLSGSRTHQRDLAIASRALAAVMHEFPNTRLVLVRDTVIFDEFPELRELQAQIEWRDLAAHSDTPYEYGRYDINIAPLEVDNPFCEAKSELKFYEAALVGVPTVASPTQPFRDSIRHQVTGYLANDDLEWYQYLKLLVSRPDLRKRMGIAAMDEVLWLYGPERRAVLVQTLAGSLLSPVPINSKLFSFQIGFTNAVCPSRPQTADREVIFQTSRTGSADISVVLPLYNYERYVIEALESVRAQTYRDIDVIIVDDCSKDSSLEVAKEWLQRHGREFRQVTLLRNVRNSGLARTRNTGVDFCQSEFYFPLDPDNVLLPHCLKQALEVAETTGAGFVYPTIQEFGANNRIIGTADYNPALFLSGNYIDAMALVRKACWTAVAGYSIMELTGWEDYDFWCKLVELGFFGVRLPEVAAHYRVHTDSMLSTLTDVPGRKAKLLLDMKSRHPWLQLAMKEEPRPLST